MAFPSVCLCVLQASSGVKQWNKRWFVLVDRCLFYYKGEFATLPSRALPGQGKPGTILSHPVLLLGSALEGHWLVGISRQVR